MLAPWSFALAGLVYGLFALGLRHLGYLHTPGDWTRRAVVAAVACSALWGALELALLLTGEAVFSLLSALADLGRYGSWYAFMLLLLHTDRIDSASHGMAWLVPTAVALLVLAVLSLVLSELQWPAWGDPHRWALFGRMALTVFALVLLEQVFSNTEEDSRWSIKPLCLGLLGLFMFDLYLYSQAVLFTRADADTLSIRGLIHAMVVPLMAVSVLRRSDWAARVRLSPRAAFHSAALLAAGLYLMFLSAVGYYVRYFGGEWGRALQQGLVFMGLVVLAVLAFSASTRARLRVLLGKHLFHYRFDYREEWLRFTHTLAAHEGTQDVGQQVIRGLANMLESPAGALWTRNRGAASFSETARWNMAPTQASESADSSLCAFITHSGWVVNLEEYRSTPQHYGQLTLPAWLQELAQAWLVIPLVVGDTLIGFCVLASARTRMEVNWEVNDLLKTAGQQAASYLVQMQATEALLEARKFEAFNRMSAFVVHDLKNIVTQLSLMLKNAKRLGDNPDFQQDMLMTVEHALERMRHMLLQLRQGASPVEAPRDIDLVHLVEQIAAQARERGQRLELHWSEHLWIRGHEERLLRVLGHLVQNAFDATASGGRVWLRLERSGEQASLIIGDTGPGMSASFVQNRLFKPFQSTKPSGMGIGAYESYQYVQELGGTIEVESTEGKGTLLHLRLPLSSHAMATLTPALRYA